MKQRVERPIADRLLEEVARAHLQPGDSLPTERSLAAELGVSRNLVRQGFSVLEERGLVVSRRGAGRYLRYVSGSLGAKSRPVAPLEVSSIADILEARMLLEDQVAALACERRTRGEADALSDQANRLESWQDNVEFHAALAATTHNFMLERLVRDQANLLGELRPRSHYASPKELRRMRVEHGEIAAAVAARDQAAARPLMHDHLERTRQVVVSSPGRRSGRTTAT